MSDRYKIRDIDYVVTNDYKERHALQTRARWALNARQLGLLILYFYTKFYNFAQEIGFVKICFNNDGLNSIIDLSPQFPKQWID